MTSSFITGGAGFIGSRIARRLNNLNHQIQVIDDLSTGKTSNLDGIPLTVLSQCDEFYHFASPASPDAFLSQWDKIIDANINLLMYRLHMLKPGGLLVLASTSEIYGQPNTYMVENSTGSVKTLSVRGVYDEAKRLAESICFNYASRIEARVLILRIFNTYGPGMPDDGRVVNSFVKRAKEGKPLIVHGDGSHTRSFCYIDDLVEQIMRLRKWVQSQDPGCHVFNVGNDRETTIIDVAKLVADRYNVGIEYGPERPDDPKWRKPVLAKMRNATGFKDFTPIEEGVKKC